MAKKAAPRKTISKKPSTNTTKVKRSKPYPIVAIGASAGGIEAVSELLKHLSPTTGMAFVYLQHLDPTHESLLTNTLSRFTEMQVVEAKNMIPIEPNKIFVLPPNKDMFLYDGVLKLKPRPAKPVIHLPIDQFFASLADKQKEGAIGIVLSGNANDGSAGLRAIKNAGGITFAQDDSAKFKSMPKSAIAEGVVDRILPPDEIAKELERISKNKRLLQLSAIAIPETEEDKESSGDLDNILYLIKKSTGLDFSLYKKNTIKRRVIRRMLLYQHENLHQYFLYLKQHANEVNILYNDLLINVTSFFRDQDTAEYLRKTLLPKLLKSKAPNDPIRVWIPACSTGEEAYSMAILIMEALGDRSNIAAVQIFATDLSEQSINKARSGIYSKADVVEISPRRLQRFFTKVDGGYRISKQIRDLCVFAPHNVFKDPPFSRLDLISCCNLLIYLDLELQKKIITTFHYALNDGGFLILGKSETTGTLQNLFTAEDKKVKVYSRKKDNRTPLLQDANFRFTDLQKLKGNLRESHNRSSPGAQSPIPELDQLVNNLLITQFIPPSVVITKDMEIVHFRGSTGMFLEPSPGRASFNILKMARSGMSFELRNLIHKTFKTGKPQKKSGIEFKYQNVARFALIETFPLYSQGDKQLLILFREEIEPATPSVKLTASAAKRIKQLESELESTRDDMRSFIEEQEAVNEELQSANEEIVSSNEELQSINEELETSKEEVESMNEELMTMNQEMQNRNEQLAESQEYAESVFITIREALVVLDKEFRVRTANTTFYSMFNTTEYETEGRLIYELDKRQWNTPELRQILEQVIPQNAVYNGFRMDYDDPAKGKKSLVLNIKSIFQKLSGQRVILLAIEDISEHIKAQQIIDERATWFRSMADNAPVMIWVVDAEKSTIFFNKTWLEFSGRTLQQETAVGWLEGIHPADMARVIEEFNLHFKTRTSFQTEYRRRRSDGQYRWLLSISRPTYDVNGAFSGYVGSCTDVHDRKIGEQMLIESVDRIQTVLDKLPLMAWMCDQKGKIIFVNNWYTKFTGQALSEVVESFKQIIHAEDYTNVIKTWEKHMTSGDPIDLKARFQEKSSGQYQWHNIRANSVRDGDDNITGWVGTNTDIHDQYTFTAELEKQVAQRTLALQEANLNLERSNKELQQFAYAASHDLQEPLRKIITFSDRLMVMYGESLDAKGTQFLKRIDDSAHRMSHLIEDILNYSKVGTRYAFEEVYLDDVLKQVLKDQEILISEKNAIIKHTRLPVIEAMPFQMEQLLSNLVNNALKFSADDRRPQIEIKHRKLTPKEVSSIQTLNPDLPYIEIRIADNGVGFEKEYAEEIFGLFQRLQASTTGGTGIGLALCRKIVNFHNGFIRAESTPGQGSTFVVTLPVKRKEQNKN